VVGDGAWGNEGREADKEGKWADNSQSKATAAAAATANPKAAAVSTPQFPPHPGCGRGWNLEGLQVAVDEKIMLSDEKIMLDVINTLRTPRPVGALFVSSG
jgi:hypothetical protein